MDFITINDAAAMSGKSIQTIRRMIKKRRIEIKKQKTPQGFNYLVGKESLLDFLNRRPILPMEEPAQEVTEREHRSLDDDYGELCATIQNLITQNQKDKENFFQLIKTFQDRIFALEGHIKLLEAPKRTSRWKFWK